MDKNAIKKYAIWARRELIARVSQKAYQYGIRGNDIIDANADSVDGKILGDSEKRERQALIAQVKEKGFEQVMEEVAYTWFNRFSALRFMEVNGYLPTHVRVFTDDENNFKPQIIAEAIHVELDGLDMAKVYALKEADNNDELFKYLLITQCNALNEILPGMFQQIADYTELLFPDNLLREGSVIEQMIALIPENDWKDAVQIIGWLYQYYNTEPKDIVFAKLKKNIKITKENVPAATQLFTPDWIVHYMVENSLGRLWLERHPNDELKSKWDYYLDDAEQEVEVQEQLDKIREEYKTIKPEEIRVVDPCMGSGHILVYAFDVLMQIYEVYGFNQRDAANSIVENNIFGLDIDERAAQLAYFAVMMKARQYDRRFFSRKVQSHVYSICESNHLDPFYVEYFVNGDDKLTADMQTLIDDLYDAKEYGSILNITNVDFDAMYARFDEIKDEASIYAELVFDELLPFVQVAQVMAQKYDVVVTNPPYMGGSGMGGKLSNFVKKNYPNTKSDLFACFIEKGLLLAKKYGYIAMITMESWMFLSRYEKLRELLTSQKAIINMLHMPYLGKGGTSLGINFGTSAFVIKNLNIHKYKSQFDYIRYYETNDFGVPLEFPTKNERYGAKYIGNFSNIPGTPFAYWASNSIFRAFSSKNNIDTVGASRSGMQTGNNELFLRLWFEVSNIKLGFGFNNFEECFQSKKKWIPQPKGGAFRRWYGNLDYVVNYENDGNDLRNYDGTSIIKNPQYFFKRGVSWSHTTSKCFSARFLPNGCIFNVEAPSFYPNDENQLNYILGFMNTKVLDVLFGYISQTMHFMAGDMSKIPLLFISNDGLNNHIDKMVEQNVIISKTDWDSFETSWDFVKHPLVRFCSTIAESYTTWDTECTDRFNQQKANEEELNRIFIDIYGLQDELTSEVEDKDITVRKADLQREIKSLISYAIGCMFGRYSLEMDGLVYAGGEWDTSKYRSYPADIDNIIPICDDDYFEGDILGRFVKFVETVYGVATLEENLKFIADALGGNGSSREVIRKYFLSDFYSDHCSTYSIKGSGKRPIYWLFDSGKKNGFKALIYMHRYQPDIIARMRTDYVHEQQERYRTAISHLEERIDNAPTAERVKLNKQMAKLKDQATEIRAYEEKMHHLADQMIGIDLDDGVKKNYEIFKDVLAKIN